MTPSASRPTVFLVAGPNGAGKSTFFYTAIKPHIDLPFINADEMQAEANRLGENIDAYEAAARASEQRSRHLIAGHSFATETVFSHPSKIDFLQSARDHGFRLSVFHIDVDRADVSVERVKYRVREGGHDVAEDKIRTRYERNKPLIRQAILMADDGSVWDGSKLNTPPRLLLRFAAGRVVFAGDDLPDWCRRLYGGDIPGGG